MANKIKTLFTASLLASLCIGTASAVTPLLEFTFNDNITVQDNAGSLGGSVSTGGAASIGADRTGVSGLAGDRAFSSGNGGMGWNQSPYNGIASGSIDLPALQSLTITGWFNASAVLNNSAVVFRTTDGKLELRAASDGAAGTLRLVVDGVSSPRSTVVNPLWARTNEWVFFALAWDGSVLKFYQGNTTSAVAQLGADAAFVRTMSDPASGIQLAGNGANNPADARPFAGSLDNIRLYGDMLSLADLELIRSSDIQNINPAIPEPAHLSMVIGAVVIALVVAVRRRA